MAAKIPIGVDACGLPLHFKITGGGVGGSKTASVLIDGMPVAEYVVGDKGYGSVAIRGQIEKTGSKAAIPRKRHSSKGNEGMDWYLYKCRPLAGLFGCQWDDVY